MSAADPAGGLDPHAHAQRLLTRGYTCVPGLLSGAQIDVIRQGLQALWIEAGRPHLHAREDRCVGESDLIVSPVGMAVSGLLRRIPQVRTCLLLPELHEIFAAVFGPGYRLEIVVGVVSDAERAFFRWHHHVGGIDADDYRSQRIYPRFSRSERLVCTLYGCPLDDEYGTMQIVPRRIDEPCDPPVGDLHQPGRGRGGEVDELRLSAGSAVLIEQATWHAVTPMRRPGQRHFMAFYVTRGDAAPTRRRDPALDEAFERYPELGRWFVPAHPRRDP
ncbi:MAG: hypothetical protein AAGF11_25500 [Myxococcota bacterium]